MTSEVTPHQITINFEPTPVEAFDSVVDYVQHLTHSNGRLHKQIAADLDLSPSHLTRKLAQSPDDSMRFTCDNLERWLQVTRDLRPIYWLFQKYARAMTPEQIDEEIRRLRNLKQETFGTAA